MDLNSARQSVIECINNASISTDSSKKIEFLTQVEEILINRFSVPTTTNNISLLQEFLPKILEFQLDTAPLVRKFLAGFLEKACKADHSRKST